MGISMPYVLYRSDMTFGNLDRCEGTPKTVILSPLLAKDLPEYVRQTCSFAAFWSRHRYSREEAADMPISLKYRGRIPPKAGLG